MPPTSDTDLVFLDLSDALRQLDDARPSPKEVRRAFSRYVELSQRLTSAMRKDFKKRTGRSWEAKSFVGWTAATELLKYLRNQDQHGEQVFITVYDRIYYNVPEDVEIAGLPGRQFIVKSHWQMTDQMLDCPPEGTEVKLRNPGSPLNSGEVLRPEKTESQYVLYPRNPKDKRRIEAAGVLDVYVIARETFTTLSRYYEFFCRQAST